MGGTDKRRSYREEGRGGKGGGDDKWANQVQVLSREK
jgi:hypothetical protein